MLEKTIQLPLGGKYGLVSGAFCYYFLGRGILDGNLPEI